MEDKILAIFEWLLEEKKNCLAFQEASKSNLSKRWSSVQFEGLLEAIQNWFQSKYPKGLKQVGDQIVESERKKPFLRERKG